MERDREVDYNHDSSKGIGDLCRVPDAKVVRAVEAAVGKIGEMFLSYGFVKNGRREADLLRAERRAEERRLDELRRKKERRQAAERCRLEDIRRGEEIRRLEALQRERVEREEHEELRMREEQRIREVALENRRREEAADHAAYDRLGHRREI